MSANFGRLLTVTYRTVNESLASYMLTKTIYEVDCNGRPDSSVHWPGEQRHSTHACGPSMNHSRASPTFGMSALRGGAAARRSEHTSFLGPIPQCLYVWPHREWAQERSRADQYAVQALAKHILRGTQLLTKWNKG